MDILTVRNLCKRYEKFELKDVSFSMRKGEIMGFIGRNGAGKTTTLKSLLNLVHPDSGEIRFFGESFEGGELDIKSRIGFASGGIDYYQKKKLKVISDVTRRFYKDWDDTAYRRYMDMFELEEDKTPDQLSAGMKVKYSLALALSHRAELLLLDEPTSGLDPVSRDDILDVFLKLEDEGVSILFSTHITSDLDKCADDITYIKNGRIIASESMKSFVSAYRVLELDREPEGGESRYIVGLKRVKNGYTALIRAEDASRFDRPCEGADLDAIMVHMEKE